MHEIFCFKNPSRGFVRTNVVVTHNPAKFRFPNLENKREQVIHVSST